MKRWVLRIVLLLVLGSVTTVAVAWGALFSISIEARELARHRVGPKILVDTVPSGEQCYILSEYWGSTVFERVGGGTSLNESASVTALREGGLPLWVDINPKRGPLVSPVAKFYECHGWPWRALCCSTFLSADRGEVNLTGAIELPLAPRQDKGFGPVMPEVCVRIARPVRCGLF